MPFSGNFDVVRLEEDKDGVPHLSVKGESHDFGDLQAMYVAVARGGGQLPAAGGSTSGASHLEALPADAALQGVPVDQAPGSAAWTATFPQGTPPFKLGETLFLVGVAISASEPPFFWHDTKEILSRTAVPA